MKPFGDYSDSFASGWMLLRGARRVRVEADRAHLVPGDGAVEQHPEDEQHRQRDEQADVQALQLRIAPEHRQLRARLLDGRPLPR